MCKSAVRSPSAATARVTSRRRYAPLMTGIACRPTERVIRDSEFACVLGLLDRVGESTPSTAHDGDQ